MVLQSQGSLISPLLVSHLSLTYIPPFRHLFLTCLSPVYHLCPTCPSPVSHLCPTCPSPEFHLSLTCIPPVPHLFLTCPSPVSPVSHLPPAVETLSVPPAETQSSSIWLIVGVVVPVVLAVFIIIILYWKLCGSEKLEFQPDAINTIQQRQKVRGQQEAVNSFLSYTFTLTADLCRRSASGSQCQRLRLRKAPPGSAQQRRHHGDPGARPAARPR